MRAIPYGRQSVTQEDIDIVVDTLKSDYLTQGPRILEFERGFAEYIGAKYAVAVANGTAALHLCTMSLDVQPGNKVITTPITFAASANCVRYCGGEVIFADIDKDSYLIDIDKVRTLLENDINGNIKGIIPVDFAGRSVDMEQFRKLADEFNCWLIEDACHAPGGFFTDSEGNQQHCGNGNFADLAIFSFHPVKHIAAGEGGMITTDSQELYKKLLAFRTHGIIKDTNGYTNSTQLATGLNEGGQDYPGWYMEMQDLGYNYRLSDFQAALGLSQLSRAGEGLMRRREIAAEYNKAFEGKDFIQGHSGVVDGHAYHLYVIEVEDRLSLYNYLRKQAIYAQVHYIPCHLMPYYQQFGWKEGDMPNAEQYYSRCLSLPMFPTLESQEQAFVIDCIYKFFEAEQ